MDINWVTGFIEGEGSFSILFIKAKTNKFGYQIKPMFAIKLVDSELEVLEKIRQFFGNIGNIYFESNKYGRQKGMKNANDAFSFRVSKLDEVRKITRILRKVNFVSKAKEKAFRNWDECIKIISKKEHLTKEGFLKIAKLRWKMNKRKQYNRKSFCEIRIDVDPCEPYKKTGKIPIKCERCNQSLCL